MKSMIENVIQDAIRIIDKIENVSLNEKLALVVASLVMDRYLEKYKEERNGPTNPASGERLSLGHRMDHDPDAP